MKKITTLFLITITLFSFVACVGETTSNNNGKSENDNDNNVDTTTTLQEKQTNSDKNIENDITFSELVVIDNEKCTIKITGIEDDSMWGYNIKAFLENKSSDKLYMFSVENAAINGVQCDTLFATEVAAGKKSNKEISFSTDKLEENGITKYSDIELSFRVYDSNDWTAEEAAKSTVHIYPFGEEKAEKFERESQDSDNVIIDNDYVTVIVTGYEKNNIWGYTVNLFLINKTDKNIIFSVDEASVNGFMADPLYAKSVSSGKCAFSSISWSDTTLDNNSITDIETIEFKFRAYDEDNWSSDDFANETIILNP